MLKSKVLGPPGPGPVLPCCFALFMHLIKIHRAPVHSSAVQGSGEATLSSNRIAVS